MRKILNENQIDHSFHYTRRLRLQLNQGFDKGPSQNDIDMCSMKDYASIRNACIENLRNDSGLIEGIKAMEGLGLSILMEKIVKGEDLLANISHLVDISWASLHTGPWREVPSIYREVYAYGSLLLSLLQAEVGNIKDAELTLDMCLMLGGGEETQRNKALIEVYKKLLFPPVPLLPSLPTTKSSFPPRKVNKAINYFSTQKYKILFLCREKIK